MSGNAPDFLDPDRPDTVRLEVGDATALGEQALRRIGFPAEEARIITDQLIDNSLCGYRFAGLPRILAIAREARTRNARVPIAVGHETPVSAPVDGGNNVGCVAVCDPSSRHHARRPRQVASSSISRSSAKYSMK